MYCPRCGQERISTDTSFCSRCGFLLAGTLELLMTGGVNPNLPAVIPRKGNSPRSRGLKQGLFLFLLTFLIAPIIAIISAAMDVEPYVLAITSTLLVVGGLLRMVYALMFESEIPVGQAASTSAAATDQILMDRHANFGSLPPQQTFPAASYVSPAGGMWRDTNDLQPASVTDGTTRLLENEETDQ